MRAYRWAPLVLLVCACGTRPDPLPRFPRLVLWAWERPERLRFVDPHTAGVAFLIRTISWRGGEVESRPRVQPLEVPAGVALMAEPILRDAARPGIQAL